MEIMSHNDFTQLLNSLDALSPEQRQRLFRELESKMAAPSSPDATAAAESTIPARKPVWERILERTADISDKEWDKLPTDLAEQHDHYLYGTKKRSPA
jgi:hypothetical protein